MAARGVVDSDVKPDCTASDFRLIKRIGRGSYGDVFLARYKPTGGVFAVKVIDLDHADEEIEDVQREIRVISQCSCPQLTRFITSAMNESRLWIVMEYLEGGSLRNMLDLGIHLKEAHIAVIMHELLLGLKYLHSEGKIHRDVKAGNVLLSSTGGVKLADFGVTGQLTDSMTKRNTFVGTPFWMAPEVIQQSRYDSSADIWSLGITAIEMATGQAPLSSIHPMRVLFIIPKSSPPTLQGDFSSTFKDFVATCLKKNPRERPTASQLLKHKFIRKAKATKILAPLVQAVVKLRDEGMGHGSEEELPSAGASPKQPVDSGTADGGGGGGSACWDFDETVVIEPDEMADLTRRVASMARASASTTAAATATPSPASPPVTLPPPRYGELAATVTPLRSERSVAAAAASAAAAGSVAPQFPATSTTAPAPVTSAPAPVPAPAASSAGAAGTSEAGEMSESQHRMSRICKAIQWIQGDYTGSGDAELYSALATLEVGFRRLFASEDTHTSVAQLPPCDRPSAALLRRLGELAFDFDSLDFVDNNEIE